MESKVFICPFCDTQTDIDDKDKYRDKGVLYCDYYVKCPKCNAYATIETVNNKVKYPVKYYAFGNYDISEVKAYYDPKIDKYI